MMRELTPDFQTLRTFIFIYSTPGLGKVQWCIALRVKRSLGADYKND